MDAPFAPSIDGLDLLTFRCFVVGSCELENGETFSFSWLGWSWGVSNMKNLEQNYFEPSVW
jgi:hypothetical protein